MNGTLNKNSKGFTLVELLVVISIVVILVSIVIVSLISIKNQSYESTMKVQVEKVLLSLELYFNSHNGYPISTGLNTPAMPFDLNDNGTIESSEENIEICCASGTQCKLANQTIGTCAALLTSAPNEKKIVEDIDKQKLLAAAINSYTPQEESPTIIINGLEWKGVMYMCEEPYAIPGTSQSICPEGKAKYLVGLPSEIKLVKIGEIFQEGNSSSQGETPPEDNNTEIINPSGPVDDPLPFSTCKDASALNYDNSGTGHDQNLCFYPEEQKGGCTDNTNFDPPIYNSDATYDDGSCPDTPPPPQPTSCSGSVSGTTITWTVSGQYSENTFMWYIPDTDAYDPETYSGYLFYGNGPIVTTYQNKQPGVKEATAVMHQDDINYSTTSVTCYATISNTPPPPPPPPPQPASCSGSVSGTSVTWTAVVTNSNGPISYYWETKDQPNAMYESIGSGNPITITYPAGPFFTQYALVNIFDDNNYSTSAECSVTLTNSSDDY